MQKRYDQNPCPSCSKPKRKAADLCAPCRTALRRSHAKGRRGAACIDCGNAIADKGGLAQRCWPCHMQHRRNQPRKPCSISGCPNPHRAKGFCASHYAGTRMARDTNTGQPLPWNRPVRAIAAQLPCQVCGYDKMRSHIHRLTRAEGYVWGNVIAVCARCHDEIHYGLTAAPPVLMGVTPFTSSNW